MYPINTYVTILMFSGVICLNPISNNNQIISGEDCSLLNLLISKISDSSKFTIELFYNDNQLIITSKHGLKKDSTLRLTNKKTREQICARVTNNFLLNITKNDIGRTFLLEYQNGDETRNVLFKIPYQKINGSLKNQQIFCYIDVTDQSQLILKFQPLPQMYQVNTYKVEVWRQDDIKVSSAQDLRFISHNNQTLSLNYYTYNEGGNYYFTITAINEKCPEDSCLMSTTPLAHVDNKTSSLVIGMCGASLILSMAICLFHITAKKYSPESSLEPSRKILIIYQSSSKKHNTVVSTFIRLFQKIADIRVLIDVIPKANPKQPEKLCEDTLQLSNEIYYIAPPIYEEIQEIDFVTKDKFVTNIIFEHCSNKMPQIVENHKEYKLMDEFKQFLEDQNWIDKISVEEANVYGLQQRLDEAVEETNAIVNSELLPMIVVSDSQNNEDHNQLLSH